MSKSVDQSIEIILRNPLFQRLKQVIENANGWHDHEDVYSHSTKTLRIARERLSGDFITNQEAKKLYTEWLENDIFGMKQKDVSLIIALIHDCGKILHYKEGDNESTLIVKKPNGEDEFMCPGHEYWGATIVIPALLKEIDLPEKVKEYIAQVVEYHGFFSSPYFSSRESWSLEQLVADIKSHYAGYYIEGLFNMYCDGYTASAFTVGKKKIEEVFNNPSLYTPRRYFIS